MRLRPFINTVYALNCDLCQRKSTFSKNAFITLRAWSSWHCEEIHGINDLSSFEVSPSHFHVYIPAPCIHMGFN